MQIYCLLISCPKNAIKIIDYKPYCVNTEKYFYHSMISMVHFLLLHFINI